MVSTLNDSPATFQYENQSYQPGNFGGEFMGTVTLKKALAHSERFRMAAERFSPIAARGAVEMREGARAVRRIRLLF